MILNTSEAAAHLGYRTRTTLQRLLRDGHLDRYRVPGGGRQVLLETEPPGLPSLREQVQALVQIRHTSPLWRREQPAAEVTPDWERIAEAANAFLDCGAWGPPPWPAGRWATLAMVISLAEENAISRD